MTTKALFYSIINPHYAPEVVAVTTEKPYNWHGRKCRHNTGTHGRISELNGRFESEEAANARIEAVRAVTAKHEPIIRAAERALQIARRNQREEINAAIKSC